MAANLGAISSQAFADGTPQVAIVPDETAIPDSASRVVVGIGVVVGLSGTGDSRLDDGLIESSIIGVLRQVGLDVWHGQIEPGRVAKVVVTAELPLKPGRGARLAVDVTALGDATSLAGGTLLATPLRDPDGKVLAIGQGRIEVGKRMGASAGQEEREARAVTLAEGTFVDGGHAQQWTAE